MGFNYKIWAVNIQKCTKQVISFKSIIVWIWKFSFHYYCARSIFLHFYLIQILFEIIFNVTRNFGTKIFRIPSKCGIFWLNSVLNGWLKLLIVVLARKWVVVLTNCNWAIVNSVRIQKLVGHYYKSQMGYMFSATDVMLTCGPTIFLRIIVSDAFTHMKGLWAY